MAKVGSVTLQIAFRQVRMGGVLDLLEPFVQLFNGSEETQVRLLGRPDGDDMSVTRTKSGQGRTRAEAMLLALCITW